MTHPTSAASPLLSAGFRSFFPAAALWACVSMLLWILMLRGVVALPTVFHPVVWHLHELLFGFVAAAIAGFLLTAIPNWTGRPALAGTPIGILVLLWLLGRLAVASSAWIGATLAMALDLAFLVALAFLVGRELLASGSRRNLPLLAILVLLITANAMIHIGVHSGPAWVAAGERLAIALIVMLISLIGGRVIPSFTGNWLRRRGADTLPPQGGRLDMVALVLGAAALMAWAIVGFSPVTGIGLLIAGMLHTARLARWRGHRTLREPLLWILHLGYAWLVIGMLMLGWAAWMPHLGSTAIHALTAGAMGTMVAAIITRASLGHSGQALHAGPGTTLAYALILIAGLARVMAPVLGMPRAPALDLAATAWVAGYALLFILYLPLYLRR